MNHCSFTVIRSDSLLKGNKFNMRNIEEGFELRERNRALVIHAMGRIARPTESNLNKVTIVYINQKLFPLLTTVLTHLNKINGRRRCRGREPVW